jgi:ABC-type amino acid transport system permease subunit
LSRLAAAYVEVLRDVPLLPQLLFWYVLMKGPPVARMAARASSGRWSEQPLILARENAGQFRSLVQRFRI